MSPHLASGILVPNAITGHPGLELANTLSGWDEPEQHDYLTGDRALVAWAGDVGLLPVMEPAVLERVPSQAGRATRRARELRADLYECALGRADDGAWDRLGAAVRQALSAARLRPPAGHRGAARWELSWGPGGPRAVRDPARDAAELAAAAVDAAVLAAEDVLRLPLAGSVAACPGPGCGGLFIDPRGRRRWCSMALCGNRAKARRHADRQRAPA